MTKKIWNFSQRKGVFFKKDFFFPWLFFILLSLPTQILHSQTQLLEYIDSAKLNNPQIIRIEKQIKIMELQKMSVKAIYRSPKAYITSDINITPYFNNGSQFITTNPTDMAIGYDIGITNGGLYSGLINVDIPLLGKKSTQNALLLPNRQTNKLRVTLRIAYYKLNRQVTNLYYNALGEQLTYLTQKESVNLLTREVNTMELLTKKGLYSIVDYQLLKTSLSADSVKLQSMAIAYRMQLMQLKSFCGISDSTLDILRMENIVLSLPNISSSYFLLPYTNDSLIAIAQNKLFNNRYLPKVMLYSNAGLNAVSLNGLDRKLGVSTGIRFVYTLFDGSQKQINKAQSLIKIDRVAKLEKIKSKNIYLRRVVLLKSIDEARANLQKQKNLKQDYKNLILLYKAEVQKGHASVTGFLMALQNYNNMQLSYGLEQINLNKLINEYNYWNH